jgi:hypothetical protein
MDPKRNPSRPVLAAVAAQQQVIETQARQIKRLHNAIELIARYAGLSKKVAEVIKVADERNPASPVPDPADAAPYETTEQALAPLASDDPEALGATPGANQGVAADSTDTVFSPGTSVDTQPFNELLDVTAPVSGTTEHVPDDQTRIETDVRVGDPDNPEVAFPLNPAFTKQERTSSRTRTLQSLKLARLRKAAGIAEGEELDLAGQIEATASLSDEAINAEIETLSAVQKAASRRAPARSATPLRPQAARMPSFAPQQGVQRQASSAPVTSDVEDSDLFLD